MASEKARRARVERALVVARRDGRRLFVQVVGTRWPEGREHAGDLVDGPWFDSPPFEPEWGKRAEVGGLSGYVSGHTRLQRIC